MITKYNKIFAAFIVACGIATTLSSCSKDDDRIPNVESAICPSAIEMQIPAEMARLIYTDNTGSAVLPMIVGESVQLGYSLAPEEATFKEVTWSTSDATIASVADGKVEALSEKGLGYSIVTVSPTGMYAGSGVVSTLKVKVDAHIKQATSVKLSTEKTELYEGEQTVISYELEPEACTYRTLEWTSSNESIAKVDGHGVVTAVSAPSLRNPVTITATALDGSSVNAKCELIIRQKIQPQKVTIDQKYDVKSGYACAINEHTLKLDYTTYPEDCTESLIEWISSDETIATVKNGVVTFNKEGNFGQVTITANCPETGNSSSTTIDLAAGLVRETFHNPNDYTWYNAKQSGNGTSSSHVWHDGYVTITTYTANETTQRGDIKCWESHTWLHAGNYPILAFRMDDVTNIGEGISARNINIDAVGKSTSGKEYKAIANGNNKWKNLYECSDGSRVFIYDLSTQACGTGGLMPTNEVVDFRTLQVKYADIKPVSHQISYNLYWVQTFKSIDDLKKYIAGEGLTYEVLK